jgi:hypothetical protein
MNELNRIVENYILRELEIAQHRAEVCGCCTCKVRYTSLLDWLIEVSAATSPGPPRLLLEQNPG